MHLKGHLLKKKLENDYLIVKFKCNKNVIKFYFIKNELINDLSIPPMLQTDRGRRC